MTDTDQLEAEVASMTDREVLDQFERNDWGVVGKRVLAEDIADRFGLHLDGDRMIEPDLDIDPDESACVEGSPGLGVYCERIKGHEGYHMALDGRVVWYDD